MSRKKCPTSDCDCDGLKQRIAVLETAIAKTNKRIDILQGELYKQVGRLRSEVNQHVSKIRRDIKNLEKALRSLIAGVRKTAEDALKTARKALAEALKAAAAAVAAAVAAALKAVNALWQKLFGKGGKPEKVDLSPILNKLESMDQRLKSTYEKANNAAYAATQASNKIGDTYEKANAAAYAATQASNKIKDAERTILTTLGVMSAAIAGVAVAAAIAVEKQFALVFAGLTGLVQAAIAELKILSIGFASLNSMINGVQQAVNGVNNSVNRVERAIDTLLNNVNKLTLDVSYVVKLSENIFEYCKYLDKKFTNYVTDLRGDNTRAYDLIYGTRQLLESRIQGVLNLLKTRVSGNFSLPTPTGGTINFPFVGEGFDGLKSGVEQLGSGLSRILNRAYEQKIIDVFKFNAQIAQKDADGNWENLTKEITSIKIGPDATHIFDSQVLTDLQELKKREVEEPVLALADLHGLRPGGDRPVLVIAYKQKLGQKWGQSTFALSLFHPSQQALDYLFSDDSQINPRTVGKAYAFLILTDGSRLTVMSPSISSSASYLQYLLQWVDGAKIPPNYSSLIVTGEGYDPGSDTTVHARKIEYYERGQRANISPTRFKYFD